MDDEGEVGQASEQVAAHVGEWLTFRVLLDTAELTHMAHEEWAAWGMTHYGFVGTPICVHCSGSCNYMLGKWPLHPSCHRWLRDVYYPRNGEVGLEESRQWMLNRHKL